jgi:putative membrane protein
MGIQSSGTGLPPAPPSPTGHRRPDPAGGRWQARVPGILLAGFALAWIALGIAPHYRQDWLLENVLVLVAVPVLAWSHRRVPLGNGNYLALFVFGLLHEIGAHHTYSEVPYDRWLQALLGSSPQTWFDLERNHYDRAIHFFYGLLVTPSAMRLIEARAAPQGAWRWLLPVAFITSHSALYELIEGAAALVFGGELGMAYLGTQGDAWDSHHDMALALAGSAIAATWVLGWRRSRVRRAAPA